MNDDLIEELRGNRNEVIQNGTCAYMSPRPYGLWVPWHLVEKTIEALEHSKSGTEAVARWMISHGYTTGHGDDLDDLLAELVRQVMEPHKPCTCGAPNGFRHLGDCPWAEPQSSEER